MGARLAAGGTLASFPLIAAVPAFQAGNTTLAWFFILLFVFAVAGVCAPKLPVLHRSRWIGAPVALSTAGLYGGTGLRITVDPATERPRGAVLRVQVKNIGPGPMRTPMLTVLLPKGIKVDRCNHLGEHVEGGTWLAPHPHQLGPHRLADRWVGERSILAANRAFDLWIRIEIPFGAEGEYPFQLVLDSSDIHGGTYVSPLYPLTVVGPDEENEGLPIIDQLSVLVDKGEAVRDAVPDVFTGEPLEHEFAVWITEAIMGVPEQYADEIGDAEPRWTRQEIGDDFRVAQINARLRALYELRQRLAMATTGGDTHSGSGAS